MSRLGDALGAQLRAVEALEEARTSIRAIEATRLSDAELLERVARRIENAAAQVELDRRLVEELLRGVHDAGLP